MERTSGLTAWLVAFALLYSFGTMTPSALGTTAPAIAAGGKHTVGLNTNGMVWAWGLNEYGQVGNGTTNDTTAPVQVSAITDVMAIAAGQEHTVALKTNGIVWAWGLNNHGQLGSGMTNNTAVPIQVGAIADVMAIAAGQYHTVTLKTNGTVWSWGWNNSHQLGTGCSGNSTNVPIQVNGIANVATITAGGSHTVALRTDGTPWVWGDNTSGQLGIGKTSSTSTNLPVQMHGITNVKAIAAGYNQTHVLKTDGTVWGCGYGQYGELGNGTDAITNLPVQASITDVTAIAAGHSHTLALKADGTVWAWGFGGYGALGRGSGSTSLIPVQAVNLSNVIAIAAGEYYSVALKADGTVWAWGENAKGHLGIGMVSQTNAPALVIGLNLGTIAPIIITTPSPLLTGTVSTAYNQTLHATGGTTPYTWSVLSGNLPPGLGLVVSSGAITGTPTAVTTANFTVQVTGNNGSSTNKAFSLTINAAPSALTITTTSPLPDGTVGTAYNQTLHATGGTTPYTWSVVSGSLPPVLSLSSGGTISGTPTTVTNASFRVRVTDFVSATAERDFSLSVTQGVTACGSASRVLPSCGYLPGVSNTVSITVTPCTNTSAYAVEDVPPTGWTVSGIDNGGSWDSVNKKVKWGLFLDNTARTLTYQVTPPSNQTGVVQFAGTASFDSTNLVIGGSSSLDKCTALPHPADLDVNFSMVIGEVTAYGAAWKTGATWPVAPNPIPIDYLTRAGYLWKQGEVYHYDAAAAAPLCWVLGAGSAPVQAAPASTRTIAAPTAAGSAIRMLPSFYTPQNAVNVTIAVTPDPSVSAYAVEDVPPPGWTVSGIDNGGAWDSTNNMVKWGPFFDNTARTLSYQATTPAGTTGDQTFAGTASFDGVSATIGGQSTISHSKSPPTIVTLPTTTNVLAVVNGLNVVPGGEPVPFTVDVTDTNGLPWNCLWDFGDGATSTNCNPSHVFTNCGPHVVTVTVDNGFSVPASTNVSVGVACQLTISKGKLTATVNFAKPNSDTCKLTGTLDPLDLGANFSVTNKTLTVDVGGAQVPFTLDAKGRGLNGTSTCRLSYTKPTKTKPGFWTLKVVLSKGTWRDPWDAHGLHNETISSKQDYTVTLPAVVVIGDESFAAEPTLKYTATINKTGKAK